MQKIIKDMAPITQWPNATINTDAIASGMLVMIKSLPEEYQTALAIGMLPAPLMDILSKIITEKLKNECCKFYDMPETEEYRNLFELPKNKYNTVIHEITVKILKGRKHSIG